VHKASYIYTPFKVLLFMCHHLFISRFRWSYEPYPLYVQDLPPALCRLLPSQPTRFHTGRLWIYRTVRHQTSHRTVSLVNSPVTITQKHFYQKEPNEIVLPKRNRKWKEITHNMERNRSFQL